jgi:hypothetical protein
VVEDFHLTSLHHEIRPVVFLLHEGAGWSASGILAARLDPDNVGDAIHHIKETLSEFAPGMPFDYRLSGIFALGMALLTVSFLAIKAALANPVEALRYE